MGQQFNFEYETCCDVECITQLYSYGGIEHCVQNLDGVFGFVLIDTKKRSMFVARDPFGVRPLFRFVSDVGVIGFSSEAKGIQIKIN